MPNLTKFETGKIQLLGTEDTVYLNYTYINPVIKITSEDNQNVAIYDIQSNQFKVIKSNEDNIVIHYIVIESNE